MDPFKYNAAAERPENQDQPQRQPALAADTAARDLRYIKYFAWISIVIFMIAITMAVMDRFGL